MSSNSLYLALQARRDDWLSTARHTLCPANRAYALHMVHGFNARMLQILCGC